MKFEDIAEGLSSKEVKFVSARESGAVTGWAHSGNYALNWAISNRFLGGFPLGHIAEIFGSEASGKSLLVARLISEFQKRYENGITVLDDTENAFNAKWAERALGVDVDRLLLTGSVTVEQHFNVVQNILEKVSGQNPVPPTLIALDSMALLSDDHEQSNEFGNDRVGGRAKAIRKLFRMTRPLFRNQPFLYVLTNHETSSIGGYGPNTTTPGGSGSKYQASVRIALKSPQKVKKGKEVRGVVVRAQIAKNRVTSPYREATIAIPFHRPISVCSGLIPILLDLGVLKEKGRTLVYGGEDTGIYTQKTNIIKQDISAVELLEKYPDLLEKADKMLEETEDDTKFEGEVEGDEDE